MNTYDEFYEPIPEPADEPKDFLGQWLDWADAQRKYEKENGPEEDE